MKTYFMFQHDDAQNVYQTTKKREAEQYDYQVCVTGEKDDLIIVTNNDEYIDATNTSCKSETELKEKINKSWNALKTHLKEDKSKEYSDDVIYYDGDAEIWLYGVSVVNISEFDDDDMNQLFDIDDAYTSFTEIIDSSYVDGDSYPQTRIYTLG